jgi:CubicO group peptidase (beta-lactamase class C family)
LIETVIYPPAKSLHDPYIHGFLLARHGKLILEEYFHGFHREKPHDTRSASKSLTATLVGAAIQNGAPFDASSSVYEVIYGNRLSADTDPRKREMTVEHLLTMSSGFDCDDRDPSSPGNEDVMQEQTQEPDWYRYTLSLSMVRSPGEKSVYCSINANLLGAVLSSATGKSLPELFVALIAEPLQIRRYHLLLTPTDDAYMGGGIYWLPRDFMKLGQVVLNGGTWNGRRIVSREWASRATAPLVDLRGRKYGYLWWTLEYPYKGRTIRAFFAGGNGGQIVMGIPELDLLVAFYAGNYSDPVLYKIQEEFVPQYILPAIDNSGPD